MNILIGSRALEHYDRLKGRSPLDWDIITDVPQKSRPGYEFYYAFDGTTNLLIYLYCLKCFEKTNPSIFFYSDVIKGGLLIPPLKILKVLKLASRKYLGKAKHSWDLAQLKDIKLNKELLHIAALRQLEVKERVKKQFFNKYDIKRYMDHDKLHMHVNNSPLYKQVVDNVEINEKKFNALSLKDKIELVRQEVLVLALERDLIPKIKQFPFLVNKIVENFTSLNYSNSPALKWISRMSYYGQLKDHPKWLADWILNNSNNIFNGLDKWWYNKLNNLSTEFWEEVLK